MYSTAAGKFNFNFLGGRFHNIWQLLVKAIFPLGNKLCNLLALSTVQKEIANFNAIHKYFVIMFLPASRFYKNLQNTGVKHRGGGGEALRQQHLYLIRCYWPLLSLHFFTGFAIFFYGESVGDRWPQYTLYQHSGIVIWMVVLWKLPSPNKHRKTKKATTWHSQARKWVWSWNGRARYCCTCAKEFLGNGHFTGIDYSRQMVV